jgi:hypothetical protein
MTIFVCQQILIIKNHKICLKQYPQLTSFSIDGRKEICFVRFKNIILARKCKFASSEELLDGLYHDFFF